MSSPADFVIHGDIRGAENVLEKRPTTDPETTADPEARRKSQEDMINALKSAYTAKG